MISERSFVSTGYIFAHAQYKYMNIVGRRSDCNSLHEL